MTTPLKRRNDEIYQRWKAGENYIDLANEYDRFPSSLERLLWRRFKAEECPAHLTPGPSNLERHKINMPRDRQIIMARAAGLSWRKLGAQFNLSPERCRQIYMRHIRRTKHPFLPKT